MAVSFLSGALGTQCFASIHNVTHKYLDPKINLSELRQILCETIGPTLRYEPGT
ncbi:hypothetical protein [Leptospira weilii]|uniref:hypothetical protein n=1 Tax=Leptospira weilii TaxID=28184 RepID=UPI000A885A6B|nr:hypothetical protein [Leptospira weilii]